MRSCVSPLMSRIEHCRQILEANCFGNFGKKKLNELSEMYRKNSKYSKNNKFSKDCKLNCSKTLLQIFVAVLEKIGLIEIACRNLVCKSAKIAKVTRNFIAPKNTQITIARIARITTYIANRFDL